jgi:hypothetical protein
VPVGPFHHRRNGETIFHVLAVMSAARVRVDLPRSTQGRGRKRRFPMR